MFTNINLLRLKITRFINGKNVYKKKKKVKNKKKKSQRKKNENKIEIYTVLKTNLIGDSEKYNANEIKNSEFIFSYDDEVKTCFQKITKDFEQVYEIKKEYNQFKSKINLQSLKSKRNFKIKFNENLFKPFEKTHKKLD